MINITIFIIKAAARWLNPNNLPACRFFPSCSRYAEGSIRKHGLLRGSVLTALRLFKCQPFFRGGFDPVP